MSTLDPGRVEQLARIAYTAYSDTTGGKDYQGGPLREWDELTYRPQGAAWRAAATAVVHAIAAESPPDTTAGDQ